MRLTGILLSLLFLSCQSNDDGKEVKIGTDERLPVTVVSSANKELTPTEFVAWVKDKRNGLIKEKTISDINYSIQYKPTDFVVCMEKKNNTIEEVELKELKDERGPMLFFDLMIGAPESNSEILKYNLSGYLEYDQRVRYMSFQMQQDLTLIQSGKEISCSLYHFERTYDVAPYCKVMLGFDPTGLDLNKGVTLNFNDNLFGKGSIRFYFPGKTFITLPKLKTV